MYTIFIEYNYIISNYVNIVNITNNYYANNNISLDNIDPIDVIKNDLKNIIASINISHINRKQKSILLEDVKK